MVILDQCAAAHGFYGVLEITWAANFEGCCAIVCLRPAKIRVFINSRGPLILGFGGQGIVCCPLELGFFNERAASFGVSRTMG